MTEEVKPIYWLEIPDGRGIPFKDLPHLLADTMWPDKGDDDERMECALAELDFEQSLERAARSGALPVRSIVTGERYTFDRTVILSRGMVMPEHDLAPYLKASGSLIGIRRAPPPGMTYLDKDEATEKVRATANASSNDAQQAKGAVAVPFHYGRDPSLLAAPAESSTTSGAKPASETDDVAAVAGPTETKEHRQARRYEMCLSMGLVMPDNDYAGLPRGISKLAEREGITRQAFTEDVKAHIRRISNPDK